MHIPVLKKEVLEFLNPQPNENFIDCTINGGGHAVAILEKTSPKGKILGIDRDEEQIKNLKLKIKNWEKRIIPICGNFADLKKIAQEQKFDKVNGILFDLGMSSWHLEESGRGFTFLKDEPLDMRYNSENQKSKIKNQNYITAERIVNEYPREEIERILREYGEERYSRKIAKTILENRPIKTTLELVKIIKRARVYSFSRIFQALRIAVNQEFDSLEKGLKQAEEVLAPKGRLAVISFHSLEDRIVKNFFKNSNLKILTKKPIIPSKQEIKENLRSRSSKLRVGIKQ